MTRLFLLFALFGMALCPTPTRAADKPATPERTIMYEDIEVFRRLLTQQFPQAQPKSTTLRYLTTFNRSPQAAFYYDANDLNAVLDWTDGNDVLMLDAAPMIWGDMLTPSYTINEGLWASPDMFHNVPYIGNLFLRTQPKTNVNKYWATTTTTNRVVTPQSTMRVEGSYVKDLGVVYNLSMSYSEANRLLAPTKASTLAANCAHCHKSVDNKTIAPPPPATKASPKDLWDETLKDVRGVKETPASPTAPTRMNRADICVPGLITENLLQAIGQYGHRFREMKGEEKWVFVVTVQRPPAEANHPDTTKAWKPIYDELTQLAEMHLKQNQSDEAIKTYQKLIDHMSQPLKLDRETPWEAAQAMIDESTTALRGTLSKMAQLLLTANRLDEAKTAIEKAKGIKVSVADMPTKQEPTPKVTVPQKLVLTLSKKTVDDFKTSKLTLDDLRKAASVEATGFSASKKK